jgi:phosphomannomutase
MNEAAQTGSLRSSLKYEPRDLEFGTSGRRGKVVDLTQLEVYINALAELEYLQSLDTSEGGIVRGQEFFFARDLRPSSDGFVPEHSRAAERSLRRSWLPSGTLECARSTLARYPHPR